jgi:hypothetical protein
VSPSWNEVSSLADGWPRSAATSPMITVTPNAEIPTATDGTATASTGRSATTGHVGRGARRSHESRLATVSEDRRARSGMQTDGTRPPGVGGGDRSRDRDRDRTSSGRAPTDREDATHTA